MKFSGHKKQYEYFLKVEKAMSPNTVSAYCSDLQEFFDAVDLPAEEVASEDILSFFGSIDVTGRSQARMLSSFRSFFGWMQLEKLREDNPAENVDFPKLGRYIPVVLSEEEVEAIIDSVDLSSWTGLRDRAILEVLYGCGLRVSEATGLRIGDLYIKEGFLTVIGKGDKQRMVPLGESAQDALNDYIEKRPCPHPGFGDIVFLNRFGKSLSRISVFNIVKRQAVAAGVHKEISPHTFRHSFATHLIENGADLRVVQEMLGHENILTTEIYTHIESGTWQRDILSNHPDK